MDEAKNKIPVVSDLVQKKHDAKILEIEGKYISTSDYKNLRVTYLMQDKTKNLINVSNISDLVNNSD